MKKFALLISTFILISCQEVHTPITSKLGKEIKIEFSERVVFPDEEFSIQFTEVLEDSRCPIGVTCVWAGNGEIAIQFDKQRINLNTYLDPKRLTVSGYTIQLLSLSPYPIYKQKVEKEEYVAKILISKK